MKNLQEKFTKLWLLMTEIQDEIEQIEQRQIELQQLKFEFEDHKKFQDNIKEVLKSKEK